MADASPDEAPQHDLAQTNVPDLLGDWTRAVLGRPGSLGDDADRDEVENKVQAHRGRVSKMRDPFTPLAQADAKKRAAARTKERIVWEDTETMILVDAFSTGPKVLVVPKDSLLFPSDADPAYVKRLGDLAQVAASAFMARGAAVTTVPRCWINPPAALTVQQLHVHVQPGGLTKFDDDQWRAYAQRLTDAL